MANREDPDGASYRQCKEMPILPGYAFSQLFKALRDLEQNSDRDTRERLEIKAK